MKMSNFKGLSKNLGKVVTDNSPTILTALGVVGVAATGYFAHRAANQEMVETINENLKRDEFHQESMTARERAEKHWKLYIPAVTTGVMTVGCIVAANRIQVRRMAALAGAYAVVTGDFDEYRQKALEMLGVKKGAEVDEHVAQKHMEKYPSYIPGVPSGKVEFCEYTSQRYFVSTIEEVKHAQNKINHMLNNGDQPSLNDFYEALGLDATDIGDELGWKDSRLVEIDFVPTKKDDNSYVTGIRFKRGPIPKFWKARD